MEGGVMTGYRDPFPTTAPVGSFAANGFGLYDLGGNSAEWCEDFFDREQRYGVLRGESWRGHDSDHLLSSSHQGIVRTERYPTNGFRCVLASVGSTPPAAAATVSLSSSPQVSQSPASATKDAPFVNTLGMKFVPVPITGGPTGGQRVLFSVWETRVQDYEVFARETNREWPKAGFEQGPTHPAVRMNSDDAQAFCTWLTQRERKEGKLATTERYRLPSDHEWSCAVGIGEREDPAKTPADKAQKIEGAFPWGIQWPPPAGTGNYASEELRAEAEAGNEELKRYSVLAGYADGYTYTSPVGSFGANRLGLFDLGGNSAEWCDDWFDGQQQDRALRGASWAISARVRLLSTARDFYSPSKHSYVHGFRCVLAPVASTPQPAKP